MGMKWGWQPCILGETLKLKPGIAVLVYGCGSTFNLLKRFEYVFASSPSEPYQALDDT